MHNADTTGQSATLSASEWADIFHAIEIGITENGDGLRDPIHTERSPEDAKAMASVRKLAAQIGIDISHPGEPN